MRRRWLLLLILAAILSTAVSCQAREELALSDTAKKLGIDPNLNSLAEYIDSRLNAGMTYEEVHQELGRIASYEAVHQDRFPPEFSACEEVVFKFALGVYLDVFLCYDNSARLAYWERIDIP